MGDREWKPPVDGAERREPPAAERRPLAPPGPDEDPVPPPARPPLSNETKPPVLRKIPMPRVVKTARTLWLTSFVLGGAAVFIAFLSHETLVAELTETLGRLAPGYDEDEVGTLVDAVYWSSVAGLGVIITIEAVLLGVLLNRRGGVRWAQFPVLVLHAGAVLLGTAFLGIGDWGVVVELLLLAGFVLAFVGWVLCLFPRAHRWFRAADESQRRPLD